MLVYTSQDALYSLQRVDFLTHSACNPLPKPVAPHSVFVQLNVPPALFHPPRLPAESHPTLERPFLHRLRVPLLLNLILQHLSQSFLTLHVQQMNNPPLGLSIHPPDLCSPSPSLSEVLSCAVLKDSDESTAGARTTPAKRIWLIQKVSLDQSLMADIHFLHYLSCVC